MDVVIINSGSNGNCAVIDDTLIIDAGWNCTPKGKYVLLTHHHSDHTKHLDKMGGLPIYCTGETAEALREKWPYVAFQIVPTDTLLELGDYQIRFTPVKHDAPCVAFDIRKGAERILWATDFSEFLAPINLNAYDALYIECNNTLYVEDMGDVYFSETKPKDEFHRRKSFQNHCNVQYLIDMFKQQPCYAPLTLLHRSSHYYLHNTERIAELCKVANVTNPLYDVQRV